MRATRWTDRRTVLGALGLVAVTAVAGCSGGGNGEDTLPGDDYPAVDEWLTETESGGATSNYDGDIVDWRDEDDPAVSVGSAGNGGNYAYDPPAVAVTPGTELLWDWTGEGQQHNVEAEPEEQLGESDYAFSSGDPVDSETATYTYTFDTAGVALYHCEPHLSLGMKGAVVVAEAE